MAIVTPGGDREDKWSGKEMNRSPASPPPVQKQAPAQEPLPSLPAPSPQPDPAPAPSPMPPLEAEPRSAASPLQEQIADQLESELKADLEGSMYVASQRDPDQRAKILRMAREMGLPPDLVERNYDDLVKNQKRANTQSEYGRLLDENPGLVEWLRDPENATLAQDDLDKVARIEAGVRRLRKDGPSWLDVPGDAAKAAQGGYYGVKSSVYSLGVAFGLVDPDEASQIAADASTRARSIERPRYLQEAQEAYEKNAPDRQQAFESFWQHLKKTEAGIVVRMLSDYLTGSTADPDAYVPTSDAASKAMVSGAKTVAEILEGLLAATGTSDPGKALTVQIAESAPFQAMAMAPMVAGTVAGAAITGPAAPVGGVVGGATGMLAGSSIANMAGWIEEAMENRGVDPTSPEQRRKFYADPEAMAEVRAEAARKGITQGAIEAVFAMFGGKALAKARIAGAGIAGKTVAIAKDTAVETIGEGAGEFGGLTAAHKDPAKVNIDDVVMEMVASLGQSAGTAGVMGVAKSPSALRQKLSKDPVKAAKEVAHAAKDAIDAIHGAEALKEAGDAVKESKLYQRMPEKVAELVRAAAPDGEPGQVYFQADGWDEYWQARGLSPIRAAEQIMGDQGRAYQEAKRTSGVFPMSIDAYIEHVAATEHFEGLLPATRMKETGLTLLEAREVMQELPVTLEEIAKEATEVEGTVSEPMTTGEEMAEQEAALRARTLEMLSGLGFRDEDMASYADLLVSRYIARGEALGLSPVDLFAQENLSIEQTNLPKLNLPTYDSMDSLLNRIRDGDIPDESAGRGKSLVAFLKDKGGIKAEGSLAGDITGIEADRGKKGFKKLVTKKGMDLDRAAIAAHEAGYIAEADANLLLESIRGEVAGTPVYSDANLDPSISEQREVLRDLERRIRAAGIDPRASSNEEIRKALESAPVEEGVFLQGGAHEKLKLTKTRYGSRYGDWPDMSGLSAGGTTEIRVSDHAKGVRDAPDGGGGYPLSLEDHYEREQIDGVSFYRDEDWTDFVFPQGRHVTSFRKIERKLFEKYREHMVREYGVGQALLQSKGRGPFDPANLPEEVEITRADDRGLSANQAKNEVRSRLRNKTIRNAQTGMNVVVAGKGIGRARKTLQSPQQIAAFLKIDDLIGRAVYGGSNPNLDRTDTGTKAFHRFYAPIEHQGTVYPVRILVRETNMGERLYHHLVAEKGKPAGSSSDTAGADMLDAFSGSSTIKIGEFEAMVNEERGRHPLYQGDTEARGMIRIRENQKIISLFQGRDLSTLLHEFGHLFLDEYIRDLGTLKARDAATLTERQKKVIESEADVLKFLEIESWDQLKTEHHEKWAETFEAYLQSGQAPSAGLKEAFRRFKNWLMAIYKGVPRREVSPEIRAVFDRLLATEEQIQEVQTLQAQQAWPGVPESIQLAEAEAQMVAEEQLMAKVMKQELKKREKAYKDEAEKVREEVTAEIQAQPVYIALAELQRGTLPDGSPLPEDRRPIKLSKKDIVAAFGEARLKRLPKPYVYSASGGVHPEVAAEMFGFASADQMLSAIEQAPKQKDLIEQLVKERMRERHGDLILDGKLGQQAMDVVHNDKRQQMMRMRLEWLAKEKLPAVKGRVRALFRGLPSNEALRDQVQEAINSKKAREIKPILYQRAEAKAAKEALEAYLRGDFEAAYNAQLKELLNHELYREATKAKERIETIYKFMRGLERPSVQKRLANAGDRYLDQINELLEQYEFRRVSDRALRRRSSLLSFIENLDKEGIPHGIPEHVALDSRAINYRELTMSELNGVYDAARAIQNVAYLKDQLLLAQERRDRAEVASEVASSIRANKEKLSETAAKAVELAVKFDAGFVGAMFPVDSVLNDLDGKEMGPAYMHLKRPIDRAIRDVFLPMQEKMGAEAADIYERFYDASERRAMNRKVQLPGISRPLSKYEVIGLALYQGTESSRQAVMDSLDLFGRDEGKPTRQQVKTVLDTLEKKDWDFVQAVWDYNETWFPQLAEAHKRRTGMTLERLPRVEVETKWGTYPGGYMPNKYDHERGGKRAEMVANAFAEMTSGRYGRPTVRGSFLHERVGSGGKALRLDKHVWSEHLKEVATNLALAEPVNYVHRVLESPEVRTALRATGKNAVYDALRLWIEDRAAGEIFAKDLASRSLRYARATFTTSRMALNMRVAALQLSGPAAAIHDVGKVNLARGALAFATGPISGNNALANKIYELSPYMKRRATLFTTDIAEVNRITKNWPIVDSLKSIAFVFIVKAQMVSDHIVFIGAYNKGLEMFSGDTAKAAEFAEKMVDTTQGTGVFSDRSGFGRGTLSKDTRQSEWVKAFASFTTSLSAKFSRTYIHGKRQSIRRPVQLAHYILDASLSWTIEGFWLGLVSGSLMAVMSGDDDDDSIPVHLLKMAGGELVGAIPLVKEIQSIGPGRTGGGVIGATMRGIVDLGAGLADLVNAWLEDEEVKASTLKRLNNGAAVFVGHPSTAINRIIDAQDREDKGEDVDPREYLFGRPRR